MAEINTTGDPVEQICRRHISQYGYRRQEAVVKVFSSSKVEKLSLMGIMISPYLVMIKTYNDEQISTLGTQPFVVQFFYGERQDLHSCLAAHIFFHVNYPLEYCISAVYPYYHGPADDKTFITSFISLRANPANDLRTQVRNKQKIKHLFFLVEDSSSGQWYFRPEWVQEISMTSHSVMTLQCIQRDPISLVGTPVFDSQWRFVGCISKQIKLEAIPVYTSNKRVRSSNESDTGCIENFFRAKFEITFMNDIVKDVLISLTNLISQFTEQNLSSPAILVPTVLLIQALSFREQQDLTSKISEQYLQKILQQPMIQSDLETIGSRKPCLLYQLNNQLLENFLHNRSTVSTRTTDSFPSSGADTSTFLFSLSDPDEGEISPNIPTKELCLTCNVDEKD